MIAGWKDIRCASLRVDDLRALADLRGRPEIRVLLIGARAWVSWQAESADMPAILARRILPLAGVELFTLRGGQWYQLGEHLPAFGVPFGDGTAGVPLDRLVIPGKVMAERPDENRCAPSCVRLVRDEQKGDRPATALWCSLVVLMGWVERATSSQLSHLQGAWRGPSDGKEGDAEALALGSPGKLPLLTESVRYWGTDLLVPLGFRADPDLPEPAICRVVGAGAGDLVVLDENGFELIARGAFKPLTRAGVRLAHDGLSGCGRQGGSRT